MVSYLIHGGKENEIPLLARNNVLILFVGTDIGRSRRRSFLEV
jgi:hypothetical protein